MGKFIDMTGRRFGKLTCLRVHPERDQLHIQWVCKCDCGNEKAIRAASLKNQLTKSCGCIADRPATEDPKFIDLTGMEFGRLTVNSFSHSGKSRKTYWNVTCDCGSKKVVSGTAMKTKRTLSCGCYHKIKASEANKIHGLAHNHILWKRYMNMKNRCINPKNPAYKYYGGRGISVCERWTAPNGEGFLNFLKDMGQPPSPKHSLDRINVNGNYDPNNVRWATDTEQARNKRSTKFITLKGVNVALADVCEYYQLNYRLAYIRISKNQESHEASITALIKDTKKPKQKPAWAL